jgi:glyoxalase family protein
MIQTIRGIHHVTAIAIDPQANIDFYTQVVGLRLVKDTVNFDDPGTYHFYYGDKSGHPGTILTFFPFVSAGPGRSGSGMVDTVTFAVSAKSLDGWIVRLVERGVDVDGPFTRFSRPTIGFRDPDGLKLEIVTVDGLEPTDAARSDRDVAASIGGFGAVTLCVEAPERTIELLTETFGYRQVAEDSRTASLTRGKRRRRQAAPQRPGAGAVSIV